MPRGLCYRCKDCGAPVGHEGLRCRDCRQKTREARLKASAALLEPGRCEVTYCYGCGRPLYSAVGWGTKQKSDAANNNRLTCGACVAAGIPPWQPNQPRNQTRDRIRRRLFGPVAARVEGA